MFLKNALPTFTRGAAEQVTNDLTTLHFTAKLVESYLGQLLVRMHRASVAALESRLVQALAIVNDSVSV